MSNIRHWVWGMVIGGLPCIPSSSNVRTPVVRLTAESVQTEERYPKFRISNFGSNARIVPTCTSLRSKKQNWRMPPDGRPEGKPWEPGDRPCWILRAAKNCRLGHRAAGSCRTTRLLRLLLVPRHGPKTRGPCQHALPHKASHRRVSEVRRGNASLCPPRQRQR